MPRGKGLLSGESIAQIALEIPPYAARKTGELAPMILFFDGSPGMAIAFRRSCEGSNALNVLWNIVAVQTLDHRDGSIEGPIRPGCSAIAAVPVESLSPRRLTRTVTVKRNARKT